MKGSVVPMYVKTTDVEIMDSWVKTSNLELKSGVFYVQHAPVMPPKLHHLAAQLHTCIKIHIRNSKSP